MGIIAGGTVIGGNPKYEFADAGGDSERGMHIVQEVLAGTKAFRQGALSVSIDRQVDRQDTAWDGNPDVGINVSASNRSNQSVGGAVRGMTLSSRNRGTNINWVEGVNIGARNDSGKAVSTYVKGIQVRIENYGDITEDIFGIDVELSDENSNVVTHSKTGLRIRNTDQSGMGAVDRAILVSHSSTNGFTAFLKAAATAGDGVAARTGTPGTPAYALLVDIAGTLHYIPAYVAAQFAA